MERTCIWVFGILLCFDIAVSRLTCPTPKVTNGYGRIRGKQYKIIYFCRKGFKLYGSKSARCYMGRWTNPFPHCIASGCKVPDTFENGMLTAHRDDAVLSFECNEGYELRGNDHAYCDGVEWDQIPQCKLFSEIDRCDFERSSLCGWTQDTRDQFDWMWHSGKTSTDHTGPQSDHTYGPAGKNGHYIYIETSAPRVLDDTARLLSPVYPSVKSGQCFSLWYHMLGPVGENEVGDLQVKLRHPHSDSREVKLFEIEGNQGEAWQKGIFYIDRMTSSFQLVISATRKMTYVGDIAVDDINFFPCEDLPIQEVTSLSTSLDTTPAFEITETTESYTDLPIQEVTSLSTSSDTTPAFEITETTESYTNLPIQEVTSLLTSSDTTRTFEITETTEASTIVITNSTQNASDATLDSTTSTVIVKSTTQMLTTSNKISSTRRSTAEAIPTRHTTTTRILHTTGGHQSEGHEYIDRGDVLDSGHNQTKESELVAAVSKSEGMPKETKAILLSVGVGCLLVIVIVLSIVVYVRYKTKRKQQKEVFDDLHNANAIYRKTSTDILI